MPQEMRYDNSSQLYNVEKTRINMNKKSEESDESASEKINFNLWSKLKRTFQQGKINS